MHLHRIQRLWRHLWLDLADTRRAVPDTMAERLARRVTASERRHTGEVRICVESALPPSQVWRAHCGDDVRRLGRERAFDWFARLRIWDTEQNNGVLIYLLLAEQAIEIVADRGLARVVDAAQWQAVVERLGQRLREGAFEDGLTQALEEVSALLVAHFPADADTVNPDELPDAVVRA
ncbi:MAG: TPM domain-containing protein [Hydrogenophaga sp.]|uniref:TPM domain-containing protein n=1 Tax=Hydrogenophaga sp. TaxID=1904254 RepID=UPI003D9B47F0